jgi:hypothetical protein
MSGKSRYLKSLLLTAFIFMVFNAALLWREAKYFDFLHGYGFPTAFYVTGGFLGIKQFLWYGLVIDLAALLLFAQLTSRMWKRISDRKLARPA